MQRRTILAAGLAAAITTALPAAQAFAGESLREKVLGTWQLVSLVVNQGEKKVNLFGDGARGIQIMSPDGRFANIITRSSLPLYAGGNRMKGTPEEYTAIGQGSNALFGTWEVDEENDLVIFNVEVSTFPNWEGEVQRRVSTVEGGVWRYVNPMTAIGPGNVEVVWKRFE